MPRDVWGTYVSPEDFDVAEKNGIRKGAVWYRISKGWKVKDAITIPTNKKTEEYKEFKNLALSNGIADYVFRDRVKRGWTLEDAANTPKLNNKEIMRRMHKSQNRVVSEWAVKEAAKNGISHNTLYQRLYRGMPMSEAVSTPLKYPKNKKDWNHSWRRESRNSYIRWWQERCKEGNADEVVK